MESFIELFTHIIQSSVPDYWKLIQVLILFSPLVLGFCLALLLIARGKAALGFLGFLIGFCIMIHYFILAACLSIPFLFANVKAWRDFYESAWLHEYLWIIMILATLISSGFCYFYFDMNMLASCLAGLATGLVTNFMPYIAFYYILFPLSKLKNKKEKIVGTVMAKEKESWKNKATVIGYYVIFEEFPGSFCVSRTLFQSLFIGDKVELEIVKGLCGIEYCINYKRYRGERLLTDKPASGQVQRMLITSEPVK